MRDIWPVKVLHYCYTDSQELNFGDQPNLTRSNCGNIGQINKLSERDSVYCYRLSLLSGNVKMLTIKPISTRG